MCSLSFYWRIVICVSLCVSNCLRFLEYEQCVVEGMSLWIRVWYMIVGGRKQKTKC